MLLEEVESVEFFLPSLRWEETERERACDSGLTDLADLHLKTLHGCWDRDGGGTNEGRVVGRGVVGFVRTAGGGRWEGVRVAATG